MSWWTDITKPTRHLGSVIGHGLEHADKMLREHGAPDVYMGMTYNGEGLKPSYTSVDGTVHMGSPNTAPNTIPRVPAAYSRTSARTANDIAQGGMTKQEVQEFNIKHPNETVMRGQ